MCHVHVQISQHKYNHCAVQTFTNTSNKHENTWSYDNTYNHISL